MNNEVQTANEVRLRAPAGVLHNNNIAGAVSDDFISIDGVSYSNFHPSTSARDPITVTIFIPLPPPSKPSCTVVLKNKK
jgi:hypothetical protein